MVLVDLGPVDAGSVERLRTVAEDVERRGARGVLVAHGFPGTWKPFTSVALPALGVDRKGHELLRRLAADGGSVRWSGVGSSPYVHNIAFAMEGGIPADLTRRVRDRDMTRVTETWHSQLKNDRASDAMAVRLFPGLDTTLVGLLQQVDAPSERIARYTTRTGWLHLGSSSHAGTLETMTGRLRTWSKPGSERETWYKGPITPGTPRDVTTGEPMAMAMRQGDTVGTALPVFGDSDGHYAFNALNDTVTTTLRSNGTTVGTVRGGQGTWQVPGASARYELELAVQRNLAVPGLRDWKLSPPRPRAGPSIPPLPTAARPFRFWCRHTALTSTGGAALPPSSTSRWGSPLSARPATAPTPPRWRRRSPTTTGRPGRSCQ
ncbi:hypothetical protein [Streptomyces hydrogenans]|uniref:hypothetical protein n=1 Tax=Streptomyces hydrogenans TaxID=1873719 RepID=UPI003D706196